MRDKENEKCLVRIKAYAIKIMVMVIIIKYDCLGIGSGGIYTYVKQFF